MHSPRRIGVGIVGFQPPRSWAAVAHLPALRALANDYVLTGIANSSAASAQAAVAGLPGIIGFASVDDLFAAPAVDLVVITVKVPHHAALVRNAIAAGKHVLCEWPLARSLEEAEELARLADDAGVVAAVGMQAGYAPAVRRLAALLGRDGRGQGALGPLLSSTVVGHGMTWGATIERRNAYLLDGANAATMLAIAVGHMLCAVETALAPVVEVSATFATRRRFATVQETGERVAHGAPDQILLACTLADGLPLSLHYRGGLPRGAGLVWTVDGQGGSARITSPSGLIELAPLTLEMCVGDDPAWRQDTAPVDAPAVAGVADLYRALAEAIRGRASDVPCFADAVRLHRLLAAIERSAETGTRVRVAP